MRLTIVLGVVIIFLMSCTGSGGGGGGSINKDWRTGTEGLSMQFVGDNPPPEVLTNQEVSVMVEIVNRGAHDITNVDFNLGGYDPSIISFPSSPNHPPSMPIEGKSAFNPDGSVLDFVGWTGTVRLPGSVSAVDSFQQDLAVTACYEYQTIANPEICIDPNKYEYTAATKCSFGVRNLGGGQGGPVAISNIRQKTTNDKVFLEISFGNKGNGLPFTGSGINDCHVNLGITDVNTITLNSVVAGTTSFSCRPSNPVRLHNGNGYVICEGPLSGDNYYVTPLVITTTYGYRQSISRSMTVVNIE